MEPERAEFALGHEGDTTGPAESDIAEELVSQGTVLLAMREMRGTKSKELQNVKSDLVKLLEMQTSLMGKMVLLDAAVQGLGESGSIQTVAVGPSRKRGYRSEQKLPLLSTTFSDACSALPLLQLACIITTVSVSKRVPQLRCLVSEGVANYLGEFQSVAEEGTGLGT